MIILSNVYDFDGTIYNGSSPLDFVLFCVRKKPKLLLTSSGKALVGFILYVAHIISKEKCKSMAFSFLKHIYAESLVDDFWDKKRHKIKSWYLEQKENTDIIISASPEFLLKPICEELGVILIGSIVDIKTGATFGKNNSGEQKVKRLFSAFPDIEVNKFYTDSKIDLPLAKISKEPFLVKRLHEPRRLKIV